MLDSLQTLNMVLKSGKDVGLIIADRRKSMGLSLDDLVLRMGNICSRGTLNQIETNYHERKNGAPMRPRDEIVDALADALNESRNRYREFFRLPLTDAEFSPEEAFESFGFALGRTKRLSERSRDFISNQINELVDFMLSIESPDHSITDTQISGTRGKDADGGIIQSPIPEISLNDVRKLHEKQQPKRKAPRKEPDKEIK